MRRTKGYETLICFVLCVTLMLCNQVYSFGQEKYLSVVSNELLEAMSIDRDTFETGAFEETGIEYPCILWIEEVDLEPAVRYGIDQAEKTRDTLLQEYEYPYEIIVNGDEKEILVDIPNCENDEYVQTYIEAKREKARELYETRNQSFLEKELCDYNDKITYVSCYTPCFFANLTITDIYNINSQNIILFIDYNNLESEDVEEIDVSGSTAEDFILAIDDDLTTHMSIEKITSARTAYGTYGSGVKIGQIEPSCSDLPNITLRTGNQTFDGHAPVVHYIMATIAPSASFFGSGYDATADRATFYLGVEWLLTKGVNVINMSAAAYRTGSYLNNYTGCTRWIEHVAYNHDTHFVKSAGNQSDSGVTEPGMAYNIITVGATRMNGTYARRSNSSYFDGTPNVNSHWTHKPDLMAIGTFDSVNQGGTSYSAPEVTGIIALLCSFQPSLKTKQHIVKALLGATVLNNSRKHVTVDTDFKEYGAGMVNAQSALYAVNAGHYSTSTGTVSSDNPTKSYSMTVTSNDTCMRVCLAYAHRIKFGSNDIHASTSAPYAGGTIGELKVEVFNPNGTKIAYCSRAGANYKILEFDPRECGGAGTYTIKITQVNPASGGRATNFGVAWR